MSRKWNAEGLFFSSEEAILIVQKQVCPNWAGSDPVEITTN